MWKQYRKYIVLIISFMIGLAMWLSPAPEGMQEKGWHLLAIFISTIVAIIMQAMPMGAIAIVAIAVALITKTLTLQEALSGFSNHIIWLVVLAFFISRGIISTGLGTRAAYIFMRMLGKSTLGLSYGMIATDLLLAPAIPSVTARAGGIVYPILSGLSKAFGSEAGLGTSRRIASFLTQVAFQGSCVTSAMFLTSMAGNPVIKSIAAEAGVVITWGSWAVASIVPGLLSLILIPLIIYKIYPPEIKETPQAKALAHQKLKEMGPMKRDEWIMLSVFILLVGLWAGESFFKIAPTTAAMFGLAILLITGVLNWKDILKEEGAWDTMVWLGTLLMLATYLFNFGVTGVMSQKIMGHVVGLNWVTAFGVLSLVYYFSHYFFASNMAHISALYSPFLVLMIAMGTPPVLAALTLAFFSNLFGSLTHYGCGPAPIFFGTGNVTIGDWWKLGFIISVVNIIIWLVVGSMWWKLVGFW
ncbi:MAG: anion permease [Parachlamydiales bacterium]|nr:anion permease [Parachlamydiales bacterium]